MAEGGPIRGRGRAGKVRGRGVGEGCPSFTLSCSASGSGSSTVVDASGPALSRGASLWAPGPSTWWRKARGADPKRSDVARTNEDRPRVSEAQRSCRSAVLRERSRRTRQEDLSLLSSYFTRDPRRSGSEGVMGLHTQRCSRPRLVAES